MEEAGVGVPLDQVAAQWNHTVVERTPVEFFATAVFCEITGESGRIHYAVAGHPPPLLWRRASGEVQELTECRGPLLGVLPDATYRACEAWLESGDVLLLYTDGAIEARDTRGEMLDTEGLEALFARSAHLSPAEFVKRLAADIRTGREVRDDLTLIAIARTPTDPAGGKP